MVLVACVLFLIGSVGSPLKKNVLFVMSDDMRPDLSPYGQTHARTPALEAFSKFQAC